MSQNNLRKSLTLKIFFFLFNRIGIDLWRLTGNNEDAKLNEQCEKRKHLLKERIFRLARWLGRLKCLPHGRKPHSLSSVCGTHVRRKEPILKNFPLTSTRGVRSFLHSHRHTLVNKNKFKKFYDFPFYKEKRLFYTHLPESMRKMSWGNSLWCVTGKS